MISDGATSLNVTVLPANAAPGQSYYKVKDIFTTRDGSWEPSAVPYSIPQWARDGGYLKPVGSPDYFDDAGGDHHMFGCVWDTPNNRPFKNKVIHYYTRTDNANHVDMPVKAQSGWANVVMFNKFFPDQGERGAWAWYPVGLPADIVWGGGMPFGLHVSYFVAWTIETGSIVAPPTDDAERIAKLDTWARAWSTNHPGEPKYV